MSVLRGHEDLKPKVIVGFDMGFAMVQCGSEVKRYRLTIGPSGAVHAEPEPEIDGLNSIDQISTEVAAERSARRWHDVDQPIA